MKQHAIADRRKHCPRTIKVQLKLKGTQLFPQKKFATNPDTFLPEATNNEMPNELLWLSTLKVP